MFKYFSIDFDVFNSFMLIDGTNGVHKSPEIDHGIFFKKSHKDITALPAIRDELVQLIRSHGSFVMTFKMSPEPFHKGSIVWMEHRDTGINGLAFIFKFSSQNLISRMNEICNQKWTILP